MTMKNEIMKDVKEIFKKFLKEKSVKRNIAALIDKNKRI